MIFIKIDNEEDFHTAKIVSQHILDWDNKHGQLDEETRAKLAYIVHPTLDRDQHQTEIKKLFKEVQASLDVVSGDNKHLRFHRDAKSGALYFGDDAGFKEALSLYTKDMLNA